MATPAPPDTGRSASPAAAVTNAPLAHPALSLRTHSHSPSSLSRPSFHSGDLGFLTTATSKKTREDGHSDSDSGSDSLSPLPFPAALSRADFLRGDFSAAAYLSSLHDAGPAARHQTLEDLRAELRDRRAAVAAELLDLVSTHHADFLGLGDGLRGGQDRAEDLRVALLGFRRQVADLRGRVGERAREVGALSGELAGTRAAVETGRRMLDLDERVAELEGRLAVASEGRRTVGGGGGDGDGEEDGEWDRLDDSDYDDGSDDEHDGEQQQQQDKGHKNDHGTKGEERNKNVAPAFVGSSPAKLAALARDYVLIARLADELGRKLPFVRKMGERTTRCRNTILLDLSTAMKEARKAGPAGQARVMRLLAVYRTLDAGPEAVRALREK